MLLLQHGMGVTYAFISGLRHNPTSPSFTPDPFLFTLPFAPCAMVPIVHFRHGVGHYPPNNTVNAALSGVKLWCILHVGHPRVGDAWGMFVVHLLGCELQPRINMYCHSLVMTCLKRCTNFLVPNLPKMRTGSTWFASGTCPSHLNLISQN